MKSLKRKVCVYTSGRMDYGILHGLMQEISESGGLQLQIVVSGMHLSAEFGKTVDEIIADGFKPDETVEILLSGSTPISVCKSMGIAMIGYGEAIRRLQPDIVVVLGDRFENFCMAAAAHVLRVPIAHIHGGEITEGAIDEAFRHCITKMAHLHFASCEVYRRRIIQLGESPDLVFNVGALGVENIRRTFLMNPEQLAKSLRFSLNEPYFLVTFHPATLELSGTGEQFGALLSALDAFPEYRVILTKSNADSDGILINRMIDEFVEKHHERAASFSSLGMNRYLSAMEYTDAVIGNSSSGILEAPSFRVPTVNIGHRQEGRVQAESVINCSPERNAIVKSIQMAISHDFKKAIREMINPYEKKYTAKNIKKIIMKSELNSILKKTFFDIPLNHSLSNFQVRTEQ